LGNYAEPSGRSYKDAVVDMKELLTKGKIDRSAPADDAAGQAGGRLVAAEDSES
jgi:hypothetical protein